MNQKVEWINFRGRNEQDSLLIELSWLSIIHSFFVETRTTN